MGLPVFNDHVQCSETSWSLTRIQVTFAHIVLQARFWLINTLQVSAKIQKDKEKAKGVELFLLAG